MRGFGHGFSNPFGSALALPFRTASQAGLRTRARSATIFFGPESPWALLGLVPLLTGLIGSCPLYSLLGIDT